MKKLRAIDLFCCAGGATKGLQRAGFHVVGVDIAPQPHYCGDEFVQANAAYLTPLYLRAFDFAWASPPCQKFTQAQRLRGNDHPDLVDPIRQMLIAASIPYCIENVVGAPLRRPIELCGAMFGLKTYRHRRFECSFPIEQPMHEPHTVKQTKMGRKPNPGEFIQVVGNFSDVAYAREAMGIDWMTQQELREAIPPSYAEYIGRAAVAHINSIRAEAA